MKNPPIKMDLRKGVSVDNLEIIISYQDEDYTVNGQTFPIGGFTLTIPSLGLSATDDNPQRALQSLKHRLADCLFQFNRDGVEMCYNFVNIPEEGKDNIFIGGQWGKLKKAIAKKKISTNVGNTDGQGRVRGEEGYGT